MEIVPSKNRFELSLEDKEHGKTHTYEEHVHASSKTRKRQILFPGVTAGFDNFMAAKNHLKGRCESKQKDPVKVVFQVLHCKTWTLNFVLGPTRKIAHRLCAVVDSYTQEEYKPEKYYHIFRIHAVPKQQVPLTQWKKANMDTDKK